MRIPTLLQICARGRPHAKGKRLDPTAPQKRRPESPALEGSHPRTNSAKSKQCRHSRQPFPQCCSNQPHGPSIAIPGINTGSQRSRSDSSEIGRIQESVSLATQEILRSPGDTLAHGRKPSKQVMPPWKLPLGLSVTGQMCSPH